MACLSPEAIRILKKSFKDGEVTPESLNAMDSAQRRGFFASKLGEPTAKWVNETIESKLLLKNQKKGLINGIKQLLGEKHPALRDTVNKVNNMEKLLTPADEEKFMADLASKKLGTTTTLEQASHVYDLSKKVKEASLKIDPSMPNRSKERMEYGIALATFKDYVGQLKLDDKAATTKELLRDPGLLIEQISGALKSIAASMDNSFFGRQGFRTLVEEPGIWGRAFVDSFKDIKSEVLGTDTQLPTKADVFSRENAMNGKYKAIGLDIGLGSEEAFPSSLPERIPLFGRLFKASEAAYNNAALRMRADLADVWIREAEAAGVEINKESGIGEAINSLTGRGKIDLLSPKGQRVINAMVFSIKYLKSNIDLFTNPVKYIVGDKKGPGAYARKKAAKNTVKTIGVIAGILTVAKMLDPESVEEDPRSSRFGKIWVGKNHDISINISIGANSLVTLASRIIPTMHDGKWGGWVKNSKGKYVNWWDAKYGQATGKDMLVNFMTGKASPFASMLLNYFDAKNRQYEKPTIGGTITTAATPIPIQNVYQLGESQEDLLLISILTALDLIGTGVNYQPKRKGKAKF